MSEAKGYICDKCKTFEISEVSSSLPQNWMRLCIEVKVAKPDGSFASPVRSTDSTDNCFDLCSNACLAALAMERAKANDEPTPGIYTKEVTTRTPRKQRSDAGLKRKAS